MEPASLPPPPPGPPPPLLSGDSKTAASTAVASASQATSAVADGLRRQEGSKAADGGAPRPDCKSPAATSTKASAGGEGKSSKASGSSRGEPRRAAARSPMVAVEEEAEDEEEDSSTHGEAVKVAPKAAGGTRVSKKEETSAGTSGSSQGQNAKRDKDKEKDKEKEKDGAVDSQRDSRSGRDRGQRDDRTDSARDERDRRDRDRDRRRRRDEDEDRERRKRRACSSSSEDKRSKRRRDGQDAADQSDGKAEENVVVEADGTKRKTRWGPQVPDPPPPQKNSGTAAAQAASTPVPEATRLAAQQLTVQAAREKAIAAASRISETGPSPVVDRKAAFAKARRAAPPPPWIAAKALFKKNEESAPSASSGDAAQAGDAGSASEGVKKPKLDLGNLSELQRTLSAELNKLRLFIIKAKQEAEERKERMRAGGPPEPAGETDKKEYYRASPGEEFGPAPEHNRFKVEAAIGTGVFSSVFKCKDLKENRDCAVKFIRSNPMMRKAAEKEVEMYRRLEKLGPEEDPEGSRYLLNLMGVGTFEHQGHLCFIFELLMCDMRFALQKYGQGGGLQLAHVTMYLKQLFLGLRALKRLKVVHADLKPDNVLMTMDKAKIKICDFGSALDVSEQVRTQYVQPRYYRAPEIMLGAPYDTQIDLWSAGACAFEFATGRILFTGLTNNQMLKQIIDVSGAFPRRMLAEGEYSRKHFNSDGDFLKQDNSIKGEPGIVRIPPAAKPTMPILSLLQAAVAKPNAGTDPAVHAKCIQQLADLVCGCLRPGPFDRLDAEQALALPFFTDRPTLVAAAATSTTAATSTSTSTSASGTTAAPAGGTVAAAARPEQSSHA